MNTKVSHAKKPQGHQASHSAHKAHEAHEKKVKHAIPEADDTVGIAAPAAAAPAVSAPVAPAPAAPSNDEELRDAFNSIQGEIAALSPNDIVAITIDIPAAIISVLGAQVKLDQNRARVAQLPEFDIATYDKLHTYTLALGFAHTQYNLTSEPAQPVPVMVEELTKIRTTLVADATALATRNLLDGTKLNDLQGAGSFKNIIFDVLRLTTWMREEWAHIQGKTALAFDELGNAERLAVRLATALGIRAQAPEVSSAASEARSGAFTLFVNAYGQARRALSYFRWDQNDVDTILPSLYAGRGPSKKKADAPDANATQPVAPAAISPSAPAVAAVAPRVVDAGSHAATVVAPGMPGSEPFNR